MAQFIIDGLAEENKDRVKHQMREVRKCYSNPDNVDIFFSGDHGQFITTSALAADLFQALFGYDIISAPAWFTVLSRRFILLLYFNLQITISFLFILPEIISKLLLVASI